MLIACVFDYTEKMDDFTERNAPIWGLLFDYYKNFVIFYANMFSPLLIFISVIIFTSKMAARTEIVAILSSGVSFYRYLWPYFLASTFLVILSLAFNHYAVPHANKTRIAFEESYFKIAFRNHDKEIHKKIGKNELIYFESYNAQSDIGYKFSIEHWDGNGALSFKIRSDYAQYDTIKQKWTIHNYIKRHINGEEEWVEKGFEMDTAINLHPNEFERRLEYTTQMMTTPELNEYIELEKKSGSENIAHHLIEKYKRTALPFSTFVMVLIGVSISSRKVRGGVGAHLAFGLLVAVSYVFMDRVATVYALNAGLSPLLASWIPNFIYGILALYIFRLAPK